MIVNDGIIAYRKQRLYWQYRITYNQLGEMIKNQNNRCAICGREPKKQLDIDHNHKTGKVRGLLCHKCNLGIGFFNDNTELIQKAIDYLNRTN